MLLVIIPITLLIWFSTRLAKDESEKINSRYNKLLEGRLVEINSGVDKFIKKIELDFVKLIDNIIFDRIIRKT